MFNGSSWSFEKAFLERRGPELKVFIGIEHRLRGEAAEQKWVVWAKSVYKIAAADAHSTKEVDYGKHTSRGVMIVVKKEVVTLLEVKWTDWKRTERLHIFGEW